MTLRRRLVHAPPGMLLLAALLAVGGAGGCAELRYRNSTDFIERRVRASDDSIADEFFKCWVLYPARDILNGEPLARLLAGNEAWNAEGPGLADSSFCTNRTAEELDPARIARGWFDVEPPEPPYRVLKARTRGATPGFIGRDSRGSKFLFKLDHPDYPELGTAADFIAAQLFRALGYNVPPVFLVTIEGTGAARYDGRRATAALYLDNVAGHFHFDWFRNRREVRALRIACAWLNDSDRVGTNTLVVVEGGRAAYYLIDFNSCLGAWQGRPKEPWRGWRAQGDLGWALLQGVSLGLLHPEPDPDQPVVSAAVGRFEAERFDPLRWRPQLPNTAFERMTAADLRWMIEKIRVLDRPRIAAVVHAAGLSDPRDRARLIETLLARRARILRLAPTPAFGRGAAGARNSP